MTRPMFAPVRVPEGAMHRVEDQPCSACGGVHQQYRFLDPDSGPLYESSCPKAGLFDNEIVSVQPLPAPSSLVFYLEWAMPKS